MCSPKSSEDSTVSETAVTAKEQPNPSMGSDKQVTWWRSGEHSHKSQAPEEDSATVRQHEFSPAEIDQLWDCKNPDAEPRAAFKHGSKGNVTLPVSTASSLTQQSSKGWTLQPELEQWKKRYQELESDMEEVSQACRHQLKKIEELSKAAADKSQVWPSKAMLAIHSCKHKLQQIVDTKSVVVANRPVGACHTLSEMEEMSQACRRQLKRIEELSKAAADKSQVSPFKALLAVLCCHRKLKSIEL